MENIILTSCFWLFLFIVYKYSKPKRRLITKEDIFSKDAFKSLEMYGEYLDKISRKQKQLNIDIDVQISYLDLLKKSINL